MVSVSPTPPGHEPAEAIHADRPATALRGLGLPPPTELIPIPTSAALSSVDEVLDAARVEKRRPAWLVTRLRRTVVHGASTIAELAEEWGLEGLEVLARLARRVERTARFLNRELRLRWTERTSSHTAEWDSDATRLIDHTAEDPR